MQVRILPLEPDCVMDFPASLIQSLRNARKIAALTGAGISAESGLATFRDAQTGLWSKFKTGRACDGGCVPTKSEIGLGLVRVKT